MRRMYIVPNVVTAFGLAAGLFVIFKVNMIEPGMGTYKPLLTSTILILLASLADWVDGAIARVMHAESDFGFLFDSLADAVTFGVAPSVLMLKSLDLERGTLVSSLAMIAAMLYSICGILRLVRYNVRHSQIKKEGTKEMSHRHFMGLPIPAAALAMVGTTLLFAFPNFEDWVGLSETSQTVILICAATVLGYLMVSRFRFPSAKALNVRVPSTPLVFGAVLLIFLILYGVVYKFPYALAGAAWGYVLVGLLFAILRMFSRRIPRK